MDPERAVRFASVVAAIVVLCAAARAQHVEIRGRVEAPSGEPIAGATVRLADAPGAVATSGEDGRYRVGLDLSGPAPAELRLVLSAPGRVERTIWLPTDSGLSIPVGTHVLWAGGALAGVVLDEKGKPLGETTIGIRHGKHLYARARTDSQGRFRADGLSLGKLACGIDGGDHLEASDPLAIRSEEAVRTTLRPASRRSWLPFREPDPESFVLLHEALEPCVVRGRATSRGAPVAGARVSVLPVRGSSVDWQGHEIWQPAPPAIGEAMTSMEGEFRLVLRELSPLGSIVRVQAQGFATSESKPLKLLSGDTLEGLEIDLATAGSIVGRVLVNEDEEVEGTLVAAGRDGSFPRFARADAAGRFRIRGLAAGTWCVRTFRDELPRTRDASFPTTVARAPEVLATVEVGGSSSVELDRRGVVTARGRIRIAGMKLSETALEISAAGGHSSSWLDAAGWFVFDCRVQEELTLGVRLGMGEGSMTIQERRSLSGRDDVWLVDFEAGRVSGSVSETRRAAVREVHAISDSLVEDRLLCFSTARVRDDGAFEFPSLPVGTWWFRAVRPGDWDDPEPQPFEVRAGETTRVELP